MRASIVSIGNELTTGQSLDTNSRFLAQELASIGVEVIEHRTVADERKLISDALRQLAKTSDVVIASGGLGPTEDDLTRQALADALGTKLELHHPSWRQLQEFFARRGRKMVDSNRVQAMVPTGADALENPIGTAPGLYAQIDGARVFVTPGVPSEMRKMFREQVLPRLPRTDSVITFSLLHTYGLGESDIGEKIADIMRRTGPVTVGTTAAAGIVSIRLISRGETQQQADEQAEEARNELAGRLGDYLVGDGEWSMARCVGELLTDAGETFATAESCTGGLVGEMMTDVPGSSSYFRGGIIAYCNELKESQLGVARQTLVDKGAVSEPVAAEMAQGSRDRLQSDWAVGITGIAGPGGGTEEKPVGLVWIGLAGPDGFLKTHRHVFPGDREVVRHRTAMAAMNYLRLQLLERSRATAK